MLIYKNHHNIPNLVKPCQDKTSSHLIFNPHWTFSTLSSVRTTTQIKLSYKPLVHSSLSCWNHLSYLIYAVYEVSVQLSLANDNQICNLPFIFHHLLIELHPFTTFIRFVMVFYIPFNCLVIRICNSFSSVSS